MCGDTGRVDVRTGAHTVSEAGHGTTSLADYDSAVSCTNGDHNTAPNGGSSLTTSSLAYGDVVTCRTEERRVRKERGVQRLEPTSEGGLFNLKIDSQVFDNCGAGYGYGGNTGFVDGSAGAHTVSEAGHGTTSLADYDSAVSCTNGDHNTAPNGGSSLTTSSLAYGDVVTCTITNHRLPQLKVVKSLDPTSDGGLFNLKIDSQVFDNSGAGYGNGGNTGFVDVSTGAHTVSEAGHGTTSLADYDSAVSCTNGDHNTAPHGGSSLPTRPFAYGDVVTCTITNHRLPQLKVVKSLDPTSDGGLFNLKIDSQVFDNSGAGYGNGGNTGFVDVSTGAHTVSEAAHPTPRPSDLDSAVSCTNGDHNTAPNGG